MSELGNDLFNDSRKQLDRYGNTNTGDLANIVMLRGIGYALLAIVVAIEKVASAISGKK